MANLWHTNLAEVTAFVTAYQERDAVGYRLTLEQVGADAVTVPLEPEAGNLLAAAWGIPPAEAGTTSDQRTTTTTD